MSRFKRAFDIVGSCAGLLVFAPVIAVACIAVFVDDGRPLFFRQQRVGFRRRPFSIIKIRTMRDGRITRVGKVLRATGLDEVPQFVNILSGEMSAVGPRPLTESDVQRLGWTGIAHDFRWEAKPGLTGLAQIVGAQFTGEALELDRTYTARWNPLLDCQLIALSFAVNVFGKSRVQRRVRRSILARATGPFRSALVIALIAGWLIAACSPPAPSEQTPTETPSTAKSFVNRVWRVQSSNTIAPGQLYVFLSEGTLVIASPNGTPALGSWKQQDQTFTMVEEGITYPVEILELTQDRFRIRMRNPGEPVEMTLEPAAP